MDDGHRASLQDDLGVFLHEHLVQSQEERQ